MQKRFSFERDYMRYCAMSKHTAAVISERRQKLWTCLTRGMRTYEIAKELGVDHSTISRDIKYLTTQSQKANPNYHSKKDTFVDVSYAVDIASAVSLAFKDLAS
jgi:IS30 family transposase